MYPKLIVLVDVSYNLSDFILFDFFTFVVMQVLRNQSQIYYFKPIYILLV